MNFKRAFFHPIPPSLSSSARTTDYPNRGAFRRSLGPRPARVPRRVERIERRVFVDYLREKIVYRLERDLATVAWICRPKASGRFPAVLCCHGSGPGKDPLVGLLNGRECLEYHKLVAVRLARRGYVTITPDRRGFGDCAERPYNARHDQYLGELDNFYRRTRGATRTALDTWDAVVALDVLARREDVDTARIGCLGVLDGATVAAGASALDPRIKAASLVCFSNESLGGLICPRPLQWQTPLGWGVPLARARSVARRIGVRYRRAGQPGNWQHHAFDGVGELDFPALADWFDLHLA
jgi:dienelactone hydrolase